ncbi:MAG: hypothetical protein WBJ10_02065 [Daejeonella sp.]|uniref:outer membrane protein n=1 Tax=Daejeonella sp. TaxID=2805397 RepID=UPI003C7698B6
MKHYLSLLLFSISLTALGQQAPRDTVKTSDKPSLTLATLYSSNTNYYGQTTAGRFPYLLAYGGLAFNSGFSISATGYKILNADGGGTGADLTAGFDFNLSKNLSAGIGYTRSFFPDSSFFLQSQNLNMFSGKLGYDFNWLTAGLNADYNPGQEGALYLSFDVKKAIELIAFNQSDYISIEPAFEVVGSTQQITSTEEVPSSSTQNKGLGIIKLPGKRSDQKPEYRTVQSTSFDVLSYNFKLPLAYSTRKFMVEAGYQASLISRDTEASFKNPRSFFSLGLYYVL